ncbi:TPA: sulfurtransferase complex subunit TusB [Thermoplasmata archaeon]|nr:sulfurtransferase complex subunit TusB [Thermoplasmata archaeon]
MTLKSPQEHDLCEMVRRLSEKDDARVILFEDGVYNALDPRSAGRLADVCAEVFVAKDDLEARGFSESDLRTGTAADYDGIVDVIMEKTERTVTL